MEGGGGVLKRLQYSVQGHQGDLNWYYSNPPYSLVKVEGERRHVVDIGLHMR